MARPLEIEKRRAIARAAVDVLQKEGTDVSMARLADALDLKRPTLLYHFPSKAHILELALVDMLTEQAQEVMVAVEQHTHPIDRLFARMKAVHAFHDGREGRVVFLSQAIASCGGARVVELIEMGNQVFEAQRQDAIALLRKGIEEGTVAPCDPDALVATSRALTDGLMLQRVTLGLELAPVHALIWAQLYAPLRRTPKSRPTSTPPSTAPSTAKAPPKAKAPSKAKALPPARPSATPRTPAARRRRTSR